MEDIELVIKIPEEQYNLIRLSDKTAMANWVSREAMMCAIKNGTPLPKRHGDLKDADTLWDIYHSNDYDFYEALNDTPTIIEKDGD